jgi:acyl carrier protein
VCPAYETKKALDGVHGSVYVTSVKKIVLFLVPYEQEAGMDKNEVAERVRKVIVKVLEIEGSEIKETSNFVFDLGADSQQSVELVAAFEEEFEIEMDEDQALAVQSVGDAVGFIAKIVG